MRLENERLQVSFADPEKWQSQRFDCIAAEQVVLDGKLRFCTPEQVIPGRRTTFGMGLCGEFVLGGAAEETKAGDWFCKPGVGLLRQKEDHVPYDMWQRYEVRRFPVTVEATEQSAVFRQSVLCGCRGMDMEKRFSLLGNSLILDITVRNTGSRTCILKEYQHNFLSIDALPVSEGYILEADCDEAIADALHQTLRQGDEIILPSAVEVRDGRLLWKQDMDGKVFYHRSERIRQQPRYRWRLSHTRSEAAVTEQTSFAPERIDIWAVEHCVCAEFYFGTELAPGESAHWRRSWTFEG